jgi:hypothetical protein
LERLQEILGESPKGRARRDQVQSS